MIWSHLKNNLIKNYGLYLIAVFLCCLFVFGWIRHQRVHILKTQLEYTLGFRDGIDAYKAQLEGMDPDQIMERYYKYYDCE